ncbi:MAG TPA: methyl-accepting chemotaxis protein [Nitrospirae bacterium]|nr:methyl-accepting chemotaxis protein [Nitrospirota bacterium]
MINLKMKLKAKTLWIPVVIIVVNYLIIGVLFSKLTFSNSQATLNTELTRLIESEERLLKTGLSLATRTQATGDAFLGLEGDDDEMAKDVINQLKPIGLDTVYLTGMSGQVMYPKGANLPSGFIPMLMEASRSRGDVNVMYHGGKMFGYAPVVDVETPKGFLVFEINIPKELAGIASSVLDSNSHSAEEIEHTKLSAHLKNVYDEAQENSKSFLKKMMLTITAVLITTLSLIAIVLSTTSRNIIHPVRKLLEAFKKQAEGDLTQEVHVRSNDEIAELTLTFNETNRKLDKMMHNVAFHSGSVAASASQLSGASGNISENAQNQSEKTTQAASSMEELNASFLDVAKNTANAADYAKETSGLAVKGGEVVAVTIDGMSRISRSVNESADTVGALGKRSEQIGDIIKVINDIAGQTNLLALNAAIEAARAGEQGRGFAVVADEVRKLAERTTSATNEIEDMIKGIQEDTGRAVESMQAGTKEVEEGVNSANQAGDALKQIVESVQNVTDMIQQIATAAEEQSSTGEEVAINLESVADLTKQTADAVQMSSESTRNLDVLARELQELVSGFKLRNIRGEDESKDIKGRQNSSDSEQILSVN